MQPARASASACTGEGPVFDCPSIDRATPFETVLKRRSPSQVSPTRIGGFATAGEDYTAPERRARASRRRTAPRPWRAADARRAAGSGAPASAARRETRRRRWPRRWRHVHERVGGRDEDVAAPCRPRSPQGRRAPAARRCRACAARSAAARVTPPDATTCSSASCRPQPAVEPSRESRAAARIRASAASGDASADARRRAAGLAGRSATRDPGGGRDPQRGARAGNPRRVDLAEGQRAAPLGDASWRRCRCHARR